MRLIRAPRALTPLLLALAILLGGCDRAAGIIPGSGKQTPTASPTAENVTVGPRVGPGQTASDAADSSLATAVVQVIPSLEDGTPVRLGTGVVIDSARRLIAFYDTGVTGLPVTPNGGTINCTIHSSGWWAL